MVKHVMFDIDGTLVQSYEFDESLFVEAVKAVTNIDIDQDWKRYPNVTDWGLIKTFCERQAEPERYSEWYEPIKSCFIDMVSTHIESHPVAPTPGAITFFNQLRDSLDYQISIATGGWGETALLKLQSAGFDVTGVTLKSSNDHFQRTEIMKLAQTGPNTTYFGDGEWDKRACNELNYRFIAVGNRVSHKFAISDFTDAKKLFTLF